ncbi:MAG TPA: cation:proton antiporter, partial [Steroidobacteraceae bacterium]|nr:cation:proton antiporter [Steroidobacteraceae bacterium]
MPGEFLTQILILLAGSLLVLSVVRRFRLPPILGYLVVGMLLGPHSLGLVSNDESIRRLAEIGVVFLVFTLGLEFSLARMVAMKSEVLGVGGLQVLLCTAAFGGMAYAAGAGPGASVVIGGALAMSSTAIVLRQLGDQLELARAHARLALGILLFQDLAFAPLLGLATALGSGDVTGPLWLLGVAGRAALALLAVLVIGRLVARPLFREITRHRSTETFTLTVLFVALGGAWATDELGLSMPLGGFLAGMLLAETEFKHQTEAVIKPFHDILLGVFFVSVGMLLNLAELLAQLPLVLLVLVVLLATKAVVVTFVVRLFVANTRKALRTGIVVCLGGEFGFALVTLLLRGDAVDPRTGQVLLTAIALSMLVGPLLVRYNKLIADTLLRREVATTTDMALETVSTREVAAGHGHIIICGFGRVGQNLARIVERRGFTYVGLDADPLRVRDARMAGDPVVYGDAVHPEVLRTLGLEQAAVVVLTFDAPDTAARIVRTVRGLRADVPVLVRTEDDSHLDELLAAGATEVIPGTFETSLALASHLLLFLKVPPSSVLESTEEVRHERYAILRSVFRRRDVPRLPEEDDPPPPREQLYTVVLPPGATAVDRSIRDVGLDHGPVTVSAIHRAGVTGRSPAPETQLREGDVLVLWGRPEDLEQVE